MKTIILALFILLFSNCNAQQTSIDTLKANEIISDKGYAIKDIDVIISPYWIEINKRFLRWDYAQTKKEKNNTIRLEFIDNDYNVYYVYKQDNQIYKIAVETRDNYIVYVNKSRKL